MNIERLDGLPLISGKCKNATNARDPNYGNFSAILSTPRRYVLMLPSVCMEKDVAYVVKVTYSRHESNTGVDTILTDSVGSSDITQILLSAFHLVTVNGTWEN